MNSPIAIQDRMYPYSEEDFAVWLRWASGSVWNESFEFALAQAGISADEFRNYAWGKWPQPDWESAERIIEAFRAGREREIRKYEQEKRDLRNYWIDMAKPPEPVNVTLLERTTEKVKA